MSRTADQNQIVPPVTNPGLRVFERFPVDWQATVQCADWTVAERIAAANVSRGGMFLRTDRTFAVGARVEVTLKLPDASHVVMLASVRHLQAGDPASKLAAGVGIEVDAKHRNELCALVEIARIRQGKPPVSPESDGARGDESTPYSASAPPGRRGVEFPRGTLCPIVGIDLGTSYSGLAVGVGEGAYPVPDELGRLRVPSLVSYAGAGGKPVAGWDALALQRTMPEQTIPAVKRLLGVSYASDELVRYRQQHPALRLTAGPTGGPLFELSRQPLDVVQVGARILRHLKETAQTRLGMPVSQAVYAHPLSFGPTQLVALEQMAQMADVTLLSFIPEPVATARALGYGATAPELVAVCDLGGGSFDCAVMEIGPRDYRILASASDVAVGGDAFDAQLAAAVADAALKRCGEDKRPAGAAWRDLLVRSERAKRRLTTDRVTSVELPPCQDAQSSGRAVQEIDRAAYQRICEPLIRQATALCVRVLADAALRPDRLSRVSLSGGMAHLPFLQQNFEVLFGRPLADLPLRDHAVALGAALLAAQMAGHLAHEARLP